MLFPRSYAWTRTQKRVIVVSTVIGLTALMLFIYSYERHYRGPGEEILYGRWASSDFISEGTVYFHLKPNHAFSVGGDFEDEFGPWASGRWYAGGSLIFLRFSGEDFAGSRPTVWRIVDIQADEFRIRHIGDKTIYTFRRTTPQATNASNQPMERTATRYASASSITATALLRPLLALGGRRSSCSR
jgi:hypothetical protein